MDRGQHAKPKPGFLKKTVMVATLIAVAFLATSFSNEYLVQAYAVTSARLKYPPFKNEYASFFGPSTTLVR